MPDNTMLKTLFSPEVWATPAVGRESYDRHLRDEEEQALQASFMMANMELEAMDVVRKAQDGRLEQELDRIANGETQIGRQEHAERLKAELEQIMSYNGQLYTQVTDLRIALRIEIAKIIAAQTYVPQPDDAVQNDARQHDNTVDHAVQNIAPLHKAETRENTAVDRFYTELMEKMEEVKEGQKVLDERMTTLAVAVTAPQLDKAEAVNVFYAKLMEGMKQVKEGQKVVNERMATLAVAVTLLAVLFYARLV